MGHISKTSSHPAIRQQTALRLSVWTPTPHSRIPELSPIISASQPGLFLTPQNLPGPAGLGGFLTGRYCIQWRRARDVPPAIMCFPLSPGLLIEDSKRADDLRGAVCLRARGGGRTMVGRET